MMYLQSIIISDALRVVLFIVIAGILFLIVLKKITGNTIRKRNLLQDGKKAEAIVLSIQKTGLYINSLQQVKLQMQIQPEKGRNFIAEINETVSLTDLEKFRAGTRINVVYNPFNLKEVMLQKNADEKFYD